MDSGGGGRDHGLTRRELVAAGAVGALGIAALSPAASIAAFVGSPSGALSQPDLSLLSALIRVFSPTTTAAGATKLAVAYSSKLAQLPASQRQAAIQSLAELRTAGEFSPHEAGGPTPAAVGSLLRSWNPAYDHRAYGTSSDNQAQPVALSPAALPLAFADMKAPVRCPSPSSQGALLSACSTIAGEALALEDPENARMYMSLPIAPATGLA